MPALRYISETMSESELRHYSELFLSFAEGYKAEEEMFYESDYGLSSKPSNEQIISSYGMDVYEESMKFCHEMFKEEAAGLCGPTYPYQCIYPAFTVYRSPFIASLRDPLLEQKRLQGLPLFPGNLIRLHQLLSTQPLSNDSIKLTAEKANEARKKATQKLGLKDEVPNFGDVARSQKREWYKTRLSQQLPNGFECVFDKVKSFSLRKQIANGKWSLTVAVHWDDWHYTHSVGEHLSLVIGRPKLRYNPRMGSDKNLLVELSPSAGRRLNINEYSPDSYAEFCLATDAQAFMLNLLIPKIEALLLNA